MKRSKKILYLVLAALMAAVILYPLIAYSIEKLKGETTIYTKQEATVPEEVPPPTLAEPEKEIETVTPKEVSKKIPDGKGSSASVADEGIASWYDYSLPGYPNYSREIATAASRKYPRGSLLLVTNVKTGESVVVRVNDYGPEAWTDRIIDLSSAAFERIAPKSAGLARVKVELLPPNFE